MAEEKNRGKQQFKWYLVGSSEKAMRSFRWQMWAATFRYAGHGFISFKH